MADYEETLLPGATARQREVYVYLRTHGPTRQDVLAAAFGSTLRGIGGTLLALVRRDDVRIIGNLDETGGAEATTWEVPERRVKGYSRVMPRTSAQGKTDMQAANLNPTGNKAVAGGQVVFFNVRFDTGVNPDIDGIHDALVTKFGAGKVVYDTDRAARNIFNIRIKA